MVEPLAPISRLIEHLKSDPDSILKDGHKEVFIARAPARLDVMGGITDYSGGLVCQFPLAASTAVALQRRDDRQLVIKTFNSSDAAAPTKPMTLSLDDFYGTASLLSHGTMQRMFAGGKEWAACVAGVFPVLAKHKKLTRSAHGANIACYSDIPPHAGIGSDAALACATLWAMTAAYHLILDPMEIAVLAQRIENQVAGARHGISRHVTSVLGRKDHLLLLECQPHELKGFLAIPPGLMFAGIHTGKTQPNDAPYRQVRVATFMAHAILARFYADMGFKKDPSRGYLANISAENFRRYFRLILPEAITGKEFTEAYGAIADRAAKIVPEQLYHPRAAAEHHILEVDRARTFAAAMRELNDRHAQQPDAALAAKAGDCLLKSHDSCAAHTGLGHAEANTLVQLIAAQGPASGFYGARVTGSGFGGTVVLLAEESPAAREKLAAILDSYREKTGLTATLLTHSSPGATESAPVRIQTRTLS